MAYTKLFQKILASSIWNEDMATRLVWITMLCMKDQNHIVQGSIGGIAHMARVPLDECIKAIAKLEGPDPDDSSGVREGRRLERLEHGGWLVINGAAYRDSKDEDERRAWMANYMRNYRRQRKQNVNNSKHMLAPVNTSDQIRSDQINYEKDKSFSLSAEPPKKEKPDQSKPKDWAEHWTYVVTQLGMSDDDAKYLWNNWKANGFTRNGRPIKDWKAAARAWKAGKFFPSQKQK